MVAADSSPTEDASAPEPAPTVEVEISPGPVAEPAEPLVGVEQTPIEGGVLHETDVLGMRMSLELSEQFDVVRVARPGEFQLADRVTDEDGSIRIVAAMRIGGWYTREESVDPNYLGAGSIGPLDIDGWIADNELLAERLPDTVVSGRAAVVYEARLNPFSDAKFDEGCTGPCQWIFSVSEESFDPETARDLFGWWDQEARGRWFLIAIEGFDPVLVAAISGGMNAEDAAAWLDEFEETILPTIELGPDGPSMPIS